VGPPLRDVSRGPGNPWMVRFVPMNPKAPVLDLFIGHDHDAWRLYVAETSWMPGLLLGRMDDLGRFSPSRNPTRTTSIGSCSRPTRLMPRRALCGAELCSTPKLPPPRSILAQTTPHYPRAMSEAINLSGARNRPR